MDDIHELQKQNKKLNLLLQQSLIPKIGFMT